MARSATWFRRLASVTCIGASLLACDAILGIDEQGPRPTSGDADGGARPPFEACSRDVDCIAPNGCYTPHCDTVLGACTYALCEAKDRTCARGICNTSNFTCSDPRSYGFLAGSYNLPGVSSGCGPNPNACVAAAYPFLFIGSRDDVIALRADDLTGTEAVKVPIAEPTTKPGQVVASGRRIWVIGEVQGSAPPYQIAIASIDSPSDPTTPMLHATTTVVKYPFPNVVAFAAPNGGLFLVDDDPAQGFPAALLQAPLADGTTIGLADAASLMGTDGGAPFDAPHPGTVSMVRVGGFSPGTTIIGSSGARLVSYRAPSTFALITDAGLATAAKQPDLPSAPPVTTSGFSNFAQGPDGTVMIAAPMADPLGDGGCDSRGRLQWLFPNAVATTTDVNVNVDPEVWTNPLTPGCTAPDSYALLPMLPTWLDKRTALVAAPASGPIAARTVTDVRMVGRDPLEANPARHFQTAATATPKGDFSVDRIALTSSAGIGYLVLADGQGNQVTLSIVDPRCDAVAK